MERNIRVIPVLVGGAEMPSAKDLPEVLEGLSRRQARELSDTRWEYDVGKLVETIESIGVPARGSVKPSWFSRRWKLTAGIIMASAALLVTSISSVSWDSSVPGDKDSSNVSTEITKVASLVANAADSQRIEQELAREKADREQAERRADLERRRRLDREGELENDRMEAARIVERREQRETEQRAVKYVSSNAPASPPVPAASAAGLQGTIMISWTHQNVVHNAVIVATGNSGVARVSYVVPGLGVMEAEQDLTVMRNAHGVFYIGSNARIPGTNLPHPTYAPDIFRLAQMQNGNWTVSEVGSDWGHFDQATVNPF